MTIPFLHGSAQGVLLDLYVQPRASRNELVGIQGDALKIRLTSPPVEGAANRLCVEFFSRLMGIAKRDVLLVAGDKSRHKRLLLKGVAEGDALQIILGAIERGH